MTAELEIETQRTGYVTCVEVVLVDGSQCFYPKQELGAAEVVAVAIDQRRYSPAPEKRPPLRWEKR